MMTHGMILVTGCNICGVSSEVNYQRHDHPLSCVQNKIFPIQMVEEIDCWTGTWQPRNFYQDHILYE